MTLFDIYPVLLFLGVFGLAILWEVRRLVTARVAARRAVTGAMGVLVVVMIISLPVRLLAPAPLITSSRLLSWRMAGRSIGVASDPATTPTTTVLTIEVEHPGCAPIEAGPWLADPIVSSTPWSVTITMHMNDTPDTVGCSSMEGPHDGSLPLVGGYLTGIFVPVQLDEPLGGRMLFDGSTFPPAARPSR